MEPKKLAVSRIQIVHISEIQKFNKRGTIFDHILFVITRCLHIKYQLYTC